MTYTIQQVLIPTESAYTTVDVQITADRITAIAPHLDPLGTCIQGQNHLLLPGFVNSHSHSPELWQRGLIPPLPLELWLQALYSAPPLTPEQIYLSALGTAVETLLSGGTTIVDHLILIPGREAETIAAAVRAYREVGIRAFVAPLIHDEPLTASLLSHPYSRPIAIDTQAKLDLVADAVQQFHHPEAGIHLMVAPTGIQLCSDDLFLGGAELSDRYGLCRHLHLLETRAQKRLAQEKYGCSAVLHLKHLGFLNATTSLAHCVWLDEAEIALLAETRSTVVHNPLSNLRLGSGIAPLLRYRQAGVNVTFGCDGTASSDGQDVLEAIKIGSMLHNTTDLDYRRWITPREAIQMATAGGVKGLGLSDELGQLAVGQKADLVLYDLTNLSLLPRTDPIGLLVSGRPVQVVKAVWVNGQPVVVDAKVTTIDVDELRHALFQSSQWQDNGTSSDIQPVESQYRTIMGLTPV